MKSFSQIKKVVEQENSSLLKQEATSFGLDDTRLIESIDVLANNLIYASLLSENISDEDIQEVVEAIPLDTEELTDYMIQTKDNVIIINWDGSKAILEIDGNEIAIPGVVKDGEALRGAVKGALQDYEISVSEEVTQDDITDALIKSIPTNTKELVGKEFDIDGDKLSVDWNSEDGKIKLSMNGKSIDVTDKAYDIESLIDVITKTVGSDSDEKEETPKKKSEPITDPEIKQKLAVLNTIIKPRLIYKYANDNADRTRIVNAMAEYIKTGADEAKATGDLDQRALVDLLFDLIEVLTSNRNLATLLAKNATASSIGESVITEAKKKTKKKKQSTEETVDVKLDMLLKLGLVDQKIYNRAKKALSNKKAAGTVPYMRNLLFDLLDRLIAYIKKDPTLYNRIRINVMKEMNGILPRKRDIEEASCAGRKAAEEGKDKEVPESYSKHYFTKEAWLEGFDSWDGTTTIANEEEEEMKTFSEFTESVKLSEINVIGDVVNGLEVLSTSQFPTLEEAETEIKSLLGSIGLTFDGLQDGEIPLESVDGDSAVLSVFSSDDSVEEELEGDMVLKCSISEEESGVTVSAEIMVYFEDGEAVALSDVDFEVEDESEEEPEESEKEEPTKEVSEAFEMQDYYPFWGWIYPNGRLLLPTKEMRLDDDEYKHDDLIYTTDGFERGYCKFAVERTKYGKENNLEIQCPLTADPKTIEMGYDNIMGYVKRNYEDIRRIFGKPLIKIDKTNFVLVFDEYGDSVSEDYRTLDELLVNLEQEKAKLKSSKTQKKPPVKTKGKTKKPISEEFETGKVFNVVLFKPNTRRFMSSIIHADSIEEVEKIVAEEMPLYVVHSINPIEVTDTTKY